MSNLKVAGKASDICPNCKNCICHNHEFTNGIDTITAYTCEDPYDGLKREIVGDDDICCSMFELKPDHGRYPWGKDKNEPMYSELIKASKRKDELIQSYREENAKLKDKYEKLDTHYRYDEDIIKDIQDVISPGDNSIWSHSELVEEIKDLKKSNEKLQNQIKNLQTTNEESYKREEKLEDTCHKLDRRLHAEKERARRLDTELLTPLARVLYPREAKIYKPYSEVLEDIKRLIDKNETLEQRYDNIHYTLYKDWSDDSISCPRDIPSEVEIIKDLKKRAAEADYYKEKLELLDKRNTNQFVLIGEKDKQFEELTRRYNMLAKKLNDIYAILKEGNEDE